MKKLFLTAAVAFSTMIASAQFMVVTTYDGDQTETMDKITSKLGIGYIVNDDFTVGMVKGAADANGDDTYEIWARYSLSRWMDGAYAALQMPTENSTDNMDLGIGYAFNVWSGLHLEPNYTMPVNKDAAGNREGSFNFGLSYRF